MPFKTCSVIKGFPDTSRTRARPSPTCRPGVPRRKSSRKPSGDIPPLPWKTPPEAAFLLHVPLDTLVTGVLVQADFFPLLVADGDLAQDFLLDVEFLEIAACRKERRQVKAVLD